MKLEILAPIVLLAIGLVVIVTTQVVAPRRQRRAIAAALGQRGWLRVAPGEAPEWPAVERLAVERAAGSARALEIDEKIGPLATHVRRREERSGRVLDLHRDPQASRARFAAVAVHRERTTTHSFASHQRRTAESRELWLGEARRLPVEAPAAVFRWTAELMREAGAPLARARGRDPEDLRSIESPPSDRLAASLRAALAEADFAVTGRLTLFAAPEAWVLTAPLDRAAGRIDPLVDLAATLSAVLDRWPAR